eukprot:1435080-Rhodomonas_salina.1
MGVPRCRSPSAGGPDSTGIGARGQDFGKNANFLLQNLSRGEDSYTTTNPNFRLPRKLMPK